MLPVIEIALCSALLLAPALSSQSPVQPGRLVINSNPNGANIKIDGQPVNQLTNATFVVPPGKHQVAVTGGPGNLKCDTPVQVYSGQPTEVNCP
jgi:hypothetical protein